MHTELQPLMPTASLSRAAIVLTWLTSVDSLPRAAPSGRGPSSVATRCHVQQSPNWACQRDSLRSVVGSWGHQADQLGWDPSATQGSIDDARSIWLISKHLMSQLCFSNAVAILYPALTDILLGAITVPIGISPNLDTAYRHLHHPSAPGCNPTEDGGRNPQPISLLHSDLNGMQQHA